MSVKKPQLIFLIIATLAYFQNFYSKPSKQLQRGFASQVPISQYSHRGIVDRSIELKFKTEPAEKKFSSSMEITALVSMPFAFEGQLQYKWTLGQEVRLVEGDLTGSTESVFQRDVPKEIKLIVNGFDKNSLRHIGIEVWAERNGRRLFVDGLISSQQEQSFEDIVQHVEKMKAEKLGIHK